MSNIEFQPCRDFGSWCNLIILCPCAVWSPDSIQEVQGLSPFWTNSSLDPSLIREIWSKPRFWPNSSEPRSSSHSSSAGSQPLLVKLESLSHPANLSQPCTSNSESLLCYGKLGSQPYLDSQKSRVLILNPVRTVEVLTPSGRSWVLLRFEKSEIPVPLKRSRILVPSWYWPFFRLSQVPISLKGQ